MAQASARLGGGLEELLRSHEEHADTLDGTGWLSDLPYAEVAAIARYLRAFRVPVGATIVEEGARDASLALIVRGRVDIVKGSSTGQRKLLTTIGSGRTLGEMALVDGEPRSASAIARDDVELLHLSGPAFRRMLEESPTLGVKILLKIGKLMSQRLRQTSGALVELLGD